MTTTHEALKEFLSETLKNNKDLQDFCKNPLPEYITNNLAEDKKLRPYQELAIKTFIFFWENNEKEKCRHLLFNMATGTGKTLVMACCILFLYTQGYRKFVFFVSSVQIMEQAKLGFTKANFRKYLFAKKISLPNIYGEINTVYANAVKNFSKNTTLKNKNIEILFDTIQGLSSKLNEPRENQILEADFEKEKIVFLADEAHHLNGKTTSKTEKEDENTWEGTIMKVFEKNPENILLEFTATIEIENKNIREKYKNKLLYRYDFAQFRADGFCKEIGFLNSPRTHAMDDKLHSDGVEPQKRRTIINALVLSEYRKIIFEKSLNRKVNPIVLFKSANKVSSKTDMEEVMRIVSGLRVEDLKYLQELSYQDDEYGIIAGMFDFLQINKISLSELIMRIKMAFRPENMIIYNSSTKSSAGTTKNKKDEEKYITDSLATLDDENSKIRAVFIVQALKEGWDVLSLFDLVHFDLNGSKKVESSDIQLVGRGARYFPFVLEEDSIEEKENQLGLFHRRSNDLYTRKFDSHNTVDNHLALLETFYYHFIEDGNFFRKLKEKLMQEGIIPEDGEMRELFLKESFKTSETYKNGFVLVNFPEKRSKEMTKMEEDLLFNKTLEVTDYSMRFRVLSDKEENNRFAGLSAGEFHLIEKDGFNYWMLYAALYYYKNKFFRFNNLKKHIIGLESIEDFITKFLPKYTISYYHESSKKLSERDVKERFNILMYSILPEIEKSIDTTLPKMIGGNIFCPRSIKKAFEERKRIYVGDKENERAKPQKDHTEYPIDLVKANWYSHNENYGTRDEKKFVKFIEGKIPELKEKYPNSEIFLMRNELDFYLYSFKNGEKFSPDFVLFINDFDTKTLYYQCLFEVKGSHLREKDNWKEETLKMIEEISTISFETNNENEDYAQYLESVKSQNYQNIQNIGFGFYTANSPNFVEDAEYMFLKEFEEKLL